MQMLSGRQSSIIEGMFSVPFSEWRSG